MSNSNQSNSIEIEMKPVNDVVNGDGKVPQESGSVSNVDENAVKSSSPAVTNDMEIKESPKIESVPDYQPEETMNSFGLAMNIMKGIAGTGCLALPVAVKNVGIIWALVLFILVSAGYILASYQLILTNDMLGEKRNMGKGIIHTNNQYAFLCYVTMGLPGYYIFNAAVIITLVGASTGTMIAMTDFITAIPFQIGSERVHRFICQFILTIIVLILTLLKDPSLLVGVSSFGMIAMVASLIILFIFGLSTTSFTFKKEFLFPISMSGFLENLGLFVHSLAFILFLLSQTKHLKKQYKKQATLTIGIAVFAMALIYAFMGIVFLLLFIDEEGAIAVNILLSFPKDSILNVIVDIFMVITTIGSIPLYMGPICEMVEASFGRITAGKYFVTNKKCVLFRIIMICAISLLAFLFPYFNKVLSFIGNFTSILVATILPCLIHLLFFKRKLSITFRIVDVIVIIISFIAMVICTAASLKSLLSS